MTFDIFKLLLSIVWLAVIINFVYFFSAGVALTLNVIGGLLVLTHMTEYFVYHKVIARRPEGAFLSFIMTFFYGVLYWKNTPKENQ